MGKIPGEGNGYPLQYSCLENSMDRGAWYTAVSGVGKGSDMTEWLNWTELNWWRPTRPSRTNTQKRMSCHHKGLRCKSKKSRDTWSNRQVWPRVQNEAGQRLAELCQENTLVLTNNLFRQYKRRLYTWTSPDGQYQNQTDYILCSQRWRNSI